MARRRRHDADEEGPGHERWVVSYADLLTLLLAFFVVMYSISSVNEGRYRTVSEAMVQAFQANQQQAPPEKDKVKSRHGALMQGVADDILGVLDPMVRDGEVRVEDTARGIAVQINASMLFESGQAELNPAAVRSLESIARVLARAPNPIEVEGHTDNSPINSPMFPSNWELSAARASRVVRLFVQTGVPATRLSAVGFGEHRSLDTNETPEGRGRNRRVTVLILPLEVPDAGAAAPAPSGGAVSAAEPPPDAPPQGPVPQVASPYPIPPLATPPAGPAAAIPPATPVQANAPVAAPGSPPAAPAPLAPPGTAPR